MRYRAFTSESVSEGHPDKVADQISDAILDAYLAQHAKARVACETMVMPGMVVVSGEIDAKVQENNVNHEQIIREVIRDIGYIDDVAFGADSVNIVQAIGPQSQDIAQGVDGVKDSVAHKELGAGDQGMMFGYACSDNEDYMPAPIYYAHKLVKRQADLRKSGAVDFLGPDAKSQVTLHYDERGEPEQVDAIVLSTQHKMGAEALLEEMVREEIIKAVIPASLLTENTKYHINPTGRFVLGGPAADCGLTGRKIIVDTYGGMARHGGGAFSGKDPSKVDRSAHYACRYIAKHLVAAGIVKECELQVSYAIGVAEPVAIAVNTFGTGSVDEQEVQQLIKQYFDLTPEGIIQMLQLEQPMYQKTAAYGHFGRSKEGFPWEQLDGEILQKLS